MNRPILLLALVLLILALLTPSLAAAAPAPLPTEAASYAAGGAVGWHGFVARLVGYLRTVISHWFHGSNAASPCPGSGGRCEPRLDQQHGLSDPNGAVSGRPSALPLDEQHQQIDPNFAVSGGPSEPPLDEQHDLLDPNG